MALSTLNKRIKNIVVLGETGVGKSTFVNAFANYLVFHSVDEVQGQLISLIPTSFPVYDDDYVEQTTVYSTATIFTSTSGNNQQQQSNECLIQGQSATQQCKAYVFPFNEFDIRIIDTPGIGDVRGMDQDKKNFDHFLSFISQYEEIDAFLILQKPDLKRLTASFQYCLKQLLCQLSKSAGGNIVFVFTHTRASFYKPGETLALLKNLLTQINDNPREPIIKLNKNSIYCLDNECYRNVLAIQNGVPFKKWMRRTFQDSWPQAAGECRRLIEYIVGNDQQPGLKPHKTYETITVNEVRRLVINLSKPLADITSNIQDNLRVLQEHEQDIINNQNNIDKLKGKLKVPVMDLKFIELNHPATVCAHKDCAETFQLATTGVTQMHYKKRCHDHCYLTNVAKEILGDIELTKCWAMEPDGKTCRICQHQYSMHMHVYYESEVFQTEIVDKDIKKQIETKEDAKKAAEKIVKDIQDRCAKYEDEQNQITKATAKFAGFLSQKAIVPYNDSFKLYVEHLIENQKTLNEKGSNNQDTIDGLTKMLLEYDEEVKIIKDAMKNKSGDLNLKEKDIYETVHNLFKLEIYGKKIEDICNKQTKIRATECNKEQSVYQPQGGRIRQFYEWSKTKLGFGTASNKHEDEDDNDDDDRASKRSVKNKEAKRREKRDDEDDKKTQTSSKNKESAKKKSKSREDKLLDEMETLKLQYQTMMNDMVKMKVQEAMQKKKKKKGQKNMAFESGDDDDDLFMASTSTNSASSRKKDKRRNSKLTNESGFSGSETSSISFNFNLPDKPNKLSRSASKSTSKSSQKSKQIQEQSDDSNESSDDFKSYSRQQMNVKQDDKRSNKKRGRGKRSVKPKTPTPSQSSGSSESDNGLYSDLMAILSKSQSESASDSDKADEEIVLKRRTKGKAKRD